MQLSKCETRVPVNGHPNDPYTQKSCGDVKCWHAYDALRPLDIEPEPIVFRLACWYKIVKVNAQILMPWHHWTPNIERFGVLDARQI